MSRIAVIGSGISGLSAAYLLSQKHEVSLFERDTRLGGHTHTHKIETSRGVLPIDTGFIVHNDRTYPNLVRLLHKFGIQRQTSDMSFGVSCRQSGLEYSSRGWGGFFGRQNLLRLRQYRLFAEIVRFNREARDLLKDPANSEIRLVDYLHSRGFRGDFLQYYLYPMASAVWSTSLEEIEEFPAFTLVRFFENHGFLGLTTQAQWYTVQGGSSSYIPHLIEPYRERIHLGARIATVVREASAVLISFEDRSVERFDEVVLACHAPQALRLLGDPTSRERAVLAQFRTSPNHAVLHTDSRLLPRRPDARSSWNYHLGTSGRFATLTYHMNRLQNLSTHEDYCVTLNDLASIDQRRILRQMTYFHPLYTIEAIRAQAQWGEINGHNRTHYCGAYWFYGFHEDGLNSAIRVAERLGASWKLAA